MQQVTIDIQQIEGAMGYILIALFLCALLLWAEYLHDNGRRRR